MRDKLIDRIYKIAQLNDLQIMEDLRTKSNDQLIDLFTEVVIEQFINDELFPGADEL